MMFNKKVITIWSLILFSHSCYAMKYIGKQEDLRPFAGQVVAYKAIIFAPQGHFITHDFSAPDHQYAYIDPKPWTLTNARRYVMRVLLSSSVTNKKVGFELTPEILQNISLQLRSINSAEKKHILAVLKKQDASFSKGLDKNSEKSSNIVLSLVE